MNDSAGARPALTRHPNGFGFCAARAIARRRGELAPPGAWWSARRHPSLIRRLCPVQRRSSRGAPAAACHWRPEIWDQRERAPAPHPTLSPSFRHRWRRQGAPFQGDPLPCSDRVAFIGSRWYETLCFNV